MASWQHLHTMDAFISHCAWDTMAQVRASVGPKGLEEHLPHWRVRRYILAMSLDLDEKPSPTADQFAVFSSSPDDGFDSLLSVAADTIGASVSLLVLWNEAVIYVRRTGSGLPLPKLVSAPSTKSEAIFPPEWIDALGFSGPPSVLVPILRGTETIGTLGFWGDTKVVDEKNEPLARLARLSSQHLSLREESLRLERILETQKVVTDNVPALIAYWDKDQRCRFANKAYFEWFGVLPENLYGMEMKTLLGDALHKRNLSYILGALQGIPQHFDRDLIRAAKGDLRHTQASYIPHVVGGQVHGFFVLVTDVTERKRAEVAAVLAKEEAIAASKVKSQFLANMSHEIRTPMNGVLGMLALALDTPLSADQREYLVAASQSAEHLLSVINDILDFSKIEAGQITFTNDHFSLAAVLNSSLAASLIRAERKGLSVEVRVSRELPEIVVGDSVRLRQVLLNVFNNAVKFTSSGRVVLEVAADQGDLIRFTVSDTGCGIPREQLGAIFHPFQQVDDSSTRRFGGTGLGLAICRDLVERMGGRIWCESEIDKGSSFHFTVRLPATKTTEPARAERAMREPNPAGRRLRVLMAEDDPVCAKVQELLLQQLNCEVTLAESGLEAVALARKERFDLILMDVQMPSCDGIEATTRIRVDVRGASAQTPIVAVTANAYRENEAACLGAGMNAFLSKPINREELAEIVRRCRLKLAPLNVDG